jgi:NAD(P)-dependent dehydrogenase (short-subunit alcohol dehydrogenase family)
MSMEESGNVGQGLIVDANPLAESRGKEGFPRQKQNWPGSDKDLRPPADHGEETYRGAGKLTGKRALITGGDSGIGRAVAIAFAREGADVALTYYDEHEDARETAGWIEKAGRRAVVLPGDLSEVTECRQMFAKARRELGKVDILVNNAAYHGEADFLEITPEQLERTFRTNFYAYVWMAQEALKQMQAGDSIINTGSVVSLTGHARLLDYAATKAAIHNFTKSLAWTVADRGIRVNCVAPGPVWTPLIASTRDEGHIERFGTDTVWGRAAQPAEIAPSYVFLASADARYYTGEILAPTGLQSTTR